MKKFKKIQFLLALFLSITALTACNWFKDDSKQSSMEPKDDEPSSEVSIEHGILTWEADEDALSYEVIIGSETIEVSRPRLNLNIYTYGESRNIEIRAVYASGTSDLYKSSYQFPSKETQLSQITRITNILFSHTDYTPDMTKDDFEYDSDYDDYLKMSELLDYVATSFVSAGLSADDLEQWITILLGLEEGPESILELFELVEEYPHLSYQLAYVLTNSTGKLISLLLTEFDESKFENVLESYDLLLAEYNGYKIYINGIFEELSKIDDPFLEVDYYQERLLENLDFYNWFYFEDLMSDFLELQNEADSLGIPNIDDDKLDAKVIRIINDMLLRLVQENRHPNTIDTLQNLIDALYYSHQYEDTVYLDYHTYEIEPLYEEYLAASIYHKAVEFYEQHAIWNDFLYRYFQPVLFVWNELYWTKGYDDAVEFGTKLIDFSEVISNLSLLQNKKNNLYYFNLYKDLGILIKTKQELFMDGIEMVIDQMINTIYLSDPTMFTDLIVKDELTIEEILLLKDEVVSLLEEGLPSVEQYYDFYRLLFTLLSVFGDDNYPDSIDEVASSAAQVMYHSNKLYIEGLKFIDIDLIAEIESYFSSDELSDEDILELTLFIHKKLTEFINENETIFDGILDGLTEKNVRKQFYQIVESIIIHSVNYFYSPNLYDDVFSDKNVLIAMISNLFDHTDALEKTIEIIYRKGLDVYRELADTEGKLFEIINRINGSSGQETTYEDYYEFYVEYFKYLTILADLSDEDVEALLTSAIVLNKYIIARSLKLPVEDVETISEQLKPLLVDGVKLYQELQSSFYEQYQDNPNIQKIYSDETSLFLEERFVLALAYIIDAMIDEAKEDEIFAYIDRLFEDFLLDTHVLEILIVSEEEMLDFQQQTHEAFTDLLTQARSIASDPSDVESDEFRQKLQAFGEFIGIL